MEAQEASMKAAVEESGMEDGEEMSNYGRGY